MRCLVVGGGNIALQKIQQLLACKAEVTVIAPDILPEIISLPVNIHKKKYNYTDIQDSKVIIAATNSSKVNVSIYQDANKKGIPINVVDIPELCSFYMGSVFHDNDLKIAISTNGMCPSFAVYLKNHFLKISKGLWGTSLDKIANKRKKIIHKLKKYSDKKESMEHVVENSFNKINNNNEMIGKVYLVGAGPGDPELITSKGLKAIQNADVILHDALVHPHLVFDVNPLARKVYVGKRKNSHSIDQESIHLLMKKEVVKGHNVVRLKGGDPFIFGRGGEEVISLVEGNIPFQVIPGITAGIGAASEFGIPLTHRDMATSVLFITGHDASISKKQDWGLLSKLKTTLVFYMGTSNVSLIVQELMENGKSADTPIAIIQNATLENQNIIISDLVSIMEDVKDVVIFTPAIIIIGDVVANYKISQNYLHSDSIDISQLLAGVEFNY